MAEAPIPTNPGINNATYLSAVAGAEHAINTTLAPDRETLQDDWKNAAYQRNLMGLATRNDLQANERKANAGGILESGINAGRIANVQLAGQEKNESLGLKTGETEAKIGRDEEQKREDIVNKLTERIATEQGNERKAIEENETREPKPATTATGNPPSNKLGGYGAGISSLGQVRPEVAYGRAQPQTPTSRAARARVKAINKGRR